ncbi:hypothetical protein OS493_005518 [Desmophyllum pertusum]|uniref:HMG box domain-containing protein n=1 Tax=Desmophyllum pertusum TaxID=174260 RepID=A0A9X0CMJ1_9CNID|nr:hypothetical protein OS493_005518 [Desmophyllum pertusum]
MEGISRHKRTRNHQSFVQQVEGNVRRRKELLQENIRGKSEDLQCSVSKATEETSRHLWFVCQGQLFEEAGLLPEAKLTEVMKALSNQWKNISNEEKEQWKQIQEKMKEEYKEKVISFDEGLTPEERAFLEEKRGPKMRQLAKEKSKLLGRPKRPLTAYIIFVQKNIRGMESPTGSTAVERIQTLAQTWNNMTSEEKEEYVVESRQAFEQYQKDVAEWKEKHPEAA